VRDTPPSVQDGAYGYEPAAVNNFDRQSAEAPDVMPDDVAIKLGREADQSSTTWLNASRRTAWNNSSRAFQSLHPQGSKYISSSYSHRSTLYRPKTRAMVRRDEAATAAAFFANEDVVSITPADDNDPQQKAGAEMQKALLQYRLTTPPAEGGIPWFLTLLGARQDCDVYGVCAAEVYWKYEERSLGTEKRLILGDDGRLATNGDGSLKQEEFEQFEKLHDHPCVDLIAPENIRFDPGADWRDPIGTSPYVLRLLPMYIQDVRAKIDSGEWLPVSESALRASTNLEDDVTRRSRETGRIPGKDSDGQKPTAFTTCWLRVTVMKWGGRDWHYIALHSDGSLLTKPRPLEEVHLHGKRPWVCGFVVLETHKTYPSGKIELVRDLQRATNDDLNLRFDNIKMNLNPRQFVRAGVAADQADLTTFIPGKTIILNSKPNTAMNTDIVWDRPPPMGPEAYNEQDRLNLDFDEMTGAFSNSSVQSSEINQQSATGMHLMTGEASSLTEYELRLFGETFAEPVLRLLLLLERAYETDEVILELCGKRAQLAQKFGVDGVTDQLLDMEVTTRVNVGIGATNPAMKLRNFIMGAEAFGKMYGPTLAQGTNFEEVCKEVFSLLGYKDGSRFFHPDFDPRVAQLQQQLQELQGKQKGPTGPATDPQRLQIAQITAQNKLEVEKIKAQTEIQSNQMDALAQDKDNESENWRTFMQTRHEAGMKSMDHLHDHHLAEGAQQHDMAMKPPLPTQAMPAGAPPAPQAPQPTPAPAMPMATPQQPISPAAPPQPAPMEQEPVMSDQHVEQLLGAVQQGMGQMLQVFVQGIEHVAQQIEKGNQETAGIMQHIGASLEQTRQAHEQGTNALVTALGRKKRVVRGADGKVEGVEAV
jgi:hypothetical protein